MDNSIYHRSTCRGCGGRDLELVLKLKPTPIGDAYVNEAKINKVQALYPIDLYLCQDCGLAQLCDVIDPDVLYGDYIYVTSSSMGLSTHFDAYAAKALKKSGLKERAFVVDLGSNDGTLLRSFQKSGMQVLGVEPALHIAEDAARNGIETLNAYFGKDTAKTIVAKYGTARLVTANNVFANIDDLDSWVEGLDVLLSNDGLFVFESYYLADLVRNMVFDFIYHEHLTSFSVRPVKLLFERYGFDLVSVERVDTKGGSLRYYVQRKEGPLERDGSVELLLQEEDAMGLYEKVTYDEFTSKIDSLKEKLLTFLRNAKSEGKSVAGFGASITCTTLIYHFGIGEYINFLVDDNPAKQELFSPGLHIPVYPSSELSIRDPDYVVLLAWRFGEKYIEKNHDYLAAGGVFIRPVPYFEIISK